MQESEIGHGSNVYIANTTKNDGKTQAAIAFSDPIARNKWANLLINAPADAFAELMQNEEIVLSANESSDSCPVETYWLTQTLTEMWSMWNAAHPFSDWPILSEVNFHSVPRLVC